MFATDPERQAVAVARHARAVEIGRAFAEIVRDKPFVRELWVTADTEEPGIHLWLITDPLDWERHRGFHGTPSDLIEDQFPTDYIWVHVMNPVNFIGDVHESLRQDAQQVSLRAS